MFSSAKPQPKPEVRQAPSQGNAQPESKPAAANTNPTGAAPNAASRTKHPPSQIAADLTVKGDIQTPGDITVDGTVEGDISAKHLTIGEAAKIKGEVTADDVVIHGTIQGCVRGMKVRLTASARVTGDIIHKTIAIEAGAQFDGSVQRRDEPLKSDK
jgi:cytoskeletal protein CcmA (bactofilin family)